MYRKAVEKYAKDGDIYRIAYVSYQIHFIGVSQLTFNQHPDKTEAYVRLFRKDDPTFDHNSFDRVKRWRCYVASFMAVEPTEEVDLTRVSAPYLKNVLLKNADLSEDDRFDLIKHYDKVTILISPASYVMKFIASEPHGTGGNMYFVQPDKVRSGLSESVSNPTEEYKKLAENRQERVQELFGRNTIWMKDASRDDVDARKAAFKKDLEEPRVTKDHEDDVEMDDL
jgi:paired amphipathic helix protein Sin3a